MRKKMKIHNSIKIALFFILELCKTTKYKKELYIYIYIYQFWDFLLTNYTAQHI